MTERGIVSVPVGIMMISSNLVVEMIGVVEGDDGCYADPRTTTPAAPGNAMSDDLRFQLRLTLSEEFAQVTRNNPGDPSISPLTYILNRHDAVMRCQFDAFADYVSEAEANGIQNYPLYEWTKKTVDDPAKEAKYIKSFALYVGGKEVYEKDKADALEAELKPLVGGPIVVKIFKYDSDPAHNPQPPPRIGDAAMSAPGDAARPRRKAD